jgi:hypothetical protein
MKKIMIIAGLMLGTVLTYAQDIAESQVPSVVLNNFKKEFPKASDVEWEQKGVGFEVDYEIGFVDHEAWFDNTGKMIKHVEDIKVQDLPESVRNVIKKEYDGHRASDAKKITQEDQVTYQVELEKGNVEWKITFSTTGKELKKIND